MNLNTNPEFLQQQCRICLQKGDVNIWNCKVTLKSEAVIQVNSFGMDDSIEKSFLELMDIFYDSQDLLNLTDEFPLLCWQCLKDLKYCYIFYDKIKLANIQLANLYQESLNQYIEEEHLIEDVDEKDLTELKEMTEISIIETLEEDKLLHTPPYTINDANQLQTLSRTRRSKHVILDKNDAFVITQFVPETLAANAKNLSNQTKEDDEECQPPQHLLTVNLKAVEVKDLQNLENLSADTKDPAVYICQYCPQAFAKSDYLKTHIQKSHVCKFCTQPFSITEDLFKHIREVHTEHKCVICHKLLSSHTNLRHHIKRVHRIQLPAKVTLLDFIKSTNVEENMQENDVNMVDMDFNTKYDCQNADCIEMFCNNKNTEMSSTI